jgi:hypothetical protein
MSNREAAAAITAEHLEPCPFCGGTEVEIRENGRTWRGMGWGEPASVSMWHHCEATPGQPSRGIERVGRDRASAIAAWNRRAALSAPVAAQPAASGVDALWLEQATKLELAIGASAFACGNWRTGDEPPYDTLYQRWADAREALRAHLSTALTGAAKEQEEAKASLAGAAPIVKPNALEIARERGMDLDPAGNPKLPLTALESLAVDACNRVKAWAESDRKAPFPEDAHMLVDGVLMMAAQRRKGVQ